MFDAAVMASVVFQACGTGELTTRAGEMQQAHVILWWPRSVQMFTRWRACHSREDISGSIIYRGPRRVDFVATQGASDSVAIRIEEHGRDRFTVRSSSRKDTASPQGEKGMCVLP
jgi:hypothetical protein